MSNVIVWADIPVTDMQRAIEFYGHVTGQLVTIMHGRFFTLASWSVENTGISSESTMAPCELVELLVHGIGAAS